MAPLAALTASQVGLPQPAAIGLGYLVLALVLPFVIAAAHRASRRVHATASRE